MSEPQPLPHGVQINTSIGIVTFSSDLQSADYAVKENVCLKANAVDADKVCLLVLGLPCPVSHELVICFGLGRWRSPDVGAVLT